MMASKILKRLMIAIIFLAMATGTAWIVWGRLQDQSPRASGAGNIRPVPVEVAQIQRGPIALQRTFSGELEAAAEFVVAPKVSGRVERMRVNIADQVTRGQIVAELDNAEYVQAVNQARADLIVAKANLAQAKSALENAAREQQRTQSLLKRGIASDSEFDAVRQEQLAKQAQLEVAAAQVEKAQSSLETANIRLGYTRVSAGWADDDTHRQVAERYVDEGQTVAANAPLFLIVELDPIIGVIFVTEHDYARITPGQAVALTTDAYPGQRFSGRIERIAPVFNRSSRQARVELVVANPDHRLKPGMFISATVELVRLADAIIVPEQALTTRNDTSGIFIVSADSQSVIWHPVVVGIRAGNRVQIEGTGLSGRVVTLGQQLVQDGSAIMIPAVDAAVKATS